jgi:PAS domain S-box-containing protein
MFLEKRLEAILDRIESPVFVKDEQRRCVLANDAFCEMIGIPREGLLEKTDYELFPAERADAHQRLEDRVFATGEESAKEEQITDVRGNARTIVVKRTLYADETGAKYVIGTIRDITELQLVLKNMINAFVVWESVFDDKGDCVSFRFGFFNDAYARIAKLKLEDVQGKDVFEVWPDTEESWIDVCSKVAVTGVPSTFEMYHASTQGMYHCNAYRPWDTADRVCVVFEDITERKRAEKEQTRLLRILESSLNEIYVFDPESLAFEYVNQGALHNLGYTIESMQGMTPVDLKPEFTEASFRHYIAPLLRREQEQLLFTTAHRRADGSLYPVEVHLQLVEHDDRKAFLAIILDITEQKRSEEALRARELQLSQAMDLAHLAPWEHDVSAGKLVIDDSFYALLGTTAEREGGYLMTPDEFVGRFVHPDDAPFLREAMDEGLDRGLPHHVEHRIIRSDGEVRHVMMATRVLKDESGRAIRVYGATQDITERKQAEDELRQSRQQLTNIIDFLPDATFVIDKEKKVIAWNKACEEMTGVKKEEVLGKGDYAYAVPFYGEARPMLIDYVTTDSDELPNYSSVARSGNRLYARAVVPLAGQGESRVLSGHASPLFDANGNIAGAIESVRDITEFQRLEGRLRQSQKMEAIGTLAGGVAHDFNNILTVIAGFAFIAGMALDKGQPVQREHIDQITAAANKAVSLTQSLLAFSRKQQITLESHDINDIVTGTGKLLTRLLTEDIKLKITCAPEQLVILADATQIDQVLINLATNARDAMPNGGVLSIETGAAELDKAFIASHGFGIEGRYAVLTVSDTGAGMDEETAKHIFEPFFTTKEVGKGTGLGLASVYGTVKQHNGYINVYSEPRHGTTFRIYLPLTNVKREEKTPLVLEEVKEGTEAILIVEDDPLVRKLVITVLGSKGYTCMEATDGEDGIRTFLKNRDKVDLVLLDVVMPNKNGKEVLEEIRKVRPETKAVFMSGYTRDVLVEKGVEGKEVHYIAKPLSPRQLLSLVRKVLDG